MSEANVSPASGRGSWRLSLDWWAVLVALGLTVLTWTHVLPAVTW